MTHPYLHDNGYWLLLFLSSTPTAQKSIPKDMSALFCTKCEMFQVIENIVTNVSLSFWP